MNRTPRGETDRTTPAPGDGSTHGTARTTQGTSTTSTAGESRTAGDATPPRLVAPVSERDHSVGPETAPVELVEYGDYECPYCGAAYPIVKRVQAEMGDRLRFVFRNFPISTSHPHAKQAAEAAEAADAQGTFWEMHDALYEHQDALEDEDLVGYAGDLGLDVERFGRDLDEHAFAGRVTEDFRTGVRSGVNGTPTFFVNGVRYDGSWDGDALLATLESAAAGETVSGRSDEGTSSGTSDEGTRSGS